MASLGPAVLGITANAEHFVLLPAVAGALVLLGGRAAARPHGRWLLAGVLMGSAITMKQQGVFFAVFGLIWLFFQTRNAERETRKPFIASFIYLSGVALPVAGMLGWMWASGTFENFRFWCFDYARHYGSMWGWRDGFRHFWLKFKPVLWDHLLYFALGTWGLIAAWRSDRRVFWFVAGLTAAGLLATAPGLIFRPHYFILILPGLALATGWGMAEIQNSKFKIQNSTVSTLLAAALIYPLMAQFFLFFLASPEDTSRRLYRPNAFPEMRRAAFWLRDKTAPGERIAVLGSEPEVFFYARRRSSTPYLYMYPLMEPQPHAPAMQKDFMTRLERAPPRFLLHTTIPTSWLVYRNSPTGLLEWLPGFLEKHYLPLYTLHPAGEQGPWEIVIYGRRDAFPSQRVKPPIARFSQP